MPLSKLIGLEILKLQEEAKELAEAIAGYKEILGDKSKLYSVIKNRLKEYRKKFASPRKTELLNVATADYVTEFKVEDIYILIDKFGYSFP